MIELVSRYRIYVGSDNVTHEITLSDEAEIEQITSQHVKGFTIYNTLGVYEGVREDARVIEILNLDHDTEINRKVTKIAIELKVRFKQAVILITREDVELWQV